CPLIKLLELGEISFFLFLKKAKYAVGITAADMDIPVNIPMNLLLLNCPESPVLFNEFNPI
ncbi:MAG: hypothetical protein L0Y68_09105, partial [Candidatus Dadabacteria bacterium]|nr:hypothetical protein [Candidatus Dadabacteria bacterium]